MAVVTEVSRLPFTYSLSGLGGGLWHRWQSGKIPKSFFFFVYLCYGHLLSSIMVTCTFLESGRKLGVPEKENPLELGADMQIDFNCEPVTNLC